MVTHVLVCPRIVGREEELVALAQRRSTAARGHGCLVIVEGESGIGKSRLVDAFRKTLTNGRARVGVGSCREFGNTPYGPIAEALAGTSSAFAPPRGQTRAEQLLDLRARVEQDCRRRNRVLVLEDLQWADEGTLAFLHYLLSYIGSMRLLVVATYRTGGEPPARIASYLTRLARDRNCFRIALMPLSDTHIRQLVRLALRVNHSTDTKSIEEIVSRAEGNPFFAEELLTHSVEARLQRTHVGDLPRTIRATVLERLTHLDEPSIEIAVQAAVFGLRFESGLLAVTFGYDPARVLSVLRRLRDMGLIVESSSPSGYEFRHALTREALYGSMLAEEVRPIHASVLRALEGCSDSHARDLGYHAWAARDAAKCARYNELAGDREEEVFAHADAVRCYELALQGDLDTDGRARILNKAAVSASRGGMAKRAARLYDAAAAALKGHADPEQIANIYYAMGSQARLGGDNALAMSILDRALCELPAEATRARAMLQVTAALLHLDRGDGTTADALIAESACVADLPIYQNVIAYAKLNAGDVEGFRAANAAYRRLCSGLGYEQVLQARFNLAFGLCSLGIDDAAIAEFGSIVAQLQAAKLSSLEILSYANIALMHARAGRLQAARDLIERGLAIPEPTTTGPIALASAALSIGLVLRDADLIARCAPEAVAEAAFTSRINSTLGRFAGPYAWWLHSRGEQREAQLVLRRALAAIGSPFGATETILAAAELGDDITMKRAYAFLAPLGPLRHVELYAATAEHLRALRAHAGGSRSDARLHAANAARSYRAFGWPRHEARCLELLREHDVVTVSSAGALSQRERETAALVAGGAANRRIAGELAVSQRTIEKYLTSIYGKLGVRNRSELAAFVARDTGAIFTKRRSAREA